jgi:hypothetical protein
MGFYNDVILPRLCDLAMRNKELAPYRERATRAARGRVLEIGIGSGRNLPFYGATVKQVVGLEPGPKLLEMARHAPHPETSVEFFEASAEAIPLEGRSIGATSWSCEEVDTGLRQPHISSAFVHPEPAERWRIRRIFDDEEPDLRRVPMLRNYFGAYEPIDTAIAHLKARGLVTPRTKPFGKSPAKKSAKGTTLIGGRGAFDIALSRKRPPSTPSRSRSGARIDALEDCKPRRAGFGTAFPIRCAIRSSSWR